MNIRQENPVSTNTLQASTKVYYRHYTDVCKFQIVNKIAWTVVVCLFSGAVSFAQTQSDSLRVVLSKKDITPAQRVTALSMLAKATSITATDQAIQTGVQAVQLSYALPDAQYTAIAYAMLAQVYLQHDDISKAAQAVDSAVYYSGKTSSSLAKGVAWYRKSWIENVKGKSKEALASAQQSLKYLDAEGLTSWQSSVYYIIASIYANLEDGPLHKKYAQLSLQTALEKGDDDNLLCAYQSLGTYWQYNHLHHTNDRASLDSALYYNRLAMQTFLERKNSIVFHSTMAIVALNTADLFAQYFPATYRDTVFYYLDYAQRIGAETHHVEVVANCYGMKSDYEMAAGNYDNAAVLLQKGLAVVSADSAKNLATKMQFMAALASLAEKRGDYREALQYFKQHEQLYTDLYNEDKMNMTKELEAQYQAEKHVMALKALQQTAVLHKRLGYLYIGLTLASITAAFFVLRSFRFRLQLAEKAKNDAALLAQLQQQENKQLAMEKQEAELQALLKNEEAMRLLAEQQLMQERQDRLQKDLLAGTLQVEQKTELLQTLQKKITENKHDSSVLNQLSRIIDNDKRVDESLADNKVGLDDIHPDFFEKLRERSSNALSKLDLKHCSYIFLGLTNKEASQKLGVAPKSILMSRYRIKQKLGLGREEELDNYIRSLS